jgi:hypothetical protein
MRTLLVLAGGFALVCSLPLVTGCSPPKPNGATSSVEIPLIQTGSDGAVYRLSAAVFEVTAPDNTVQQLDGNVDQPSLVLQLVPGNYSVHLLPGWTLQRSTDQTTFTPVEAILGSQNPQVIDVFPDNAQQVLFRFFVRDAKGGLTIQFGVVPNPQRLLGTLAFTDASGLLQQYAGKSVDYSIYFDPTQTTTMVADGTRTRTYHADGIAVEYFNDPIGIFAGPIAQESEGGTLDFAIRVNPDNTQTLSGVAHDVTGAPLSFGPTAISVAVDANGFPVDAHFQVSAPFTLTGPTSSGSGSVVVRHELN